jgi:predicted deacylase
MTSTGNQAFPETEMLDTIEIPARGTRQRGRLRFSNPTLAEWSWPLTVIAGASEGPRVALISGVHPTEYPALEANIRVIRALDPARVRGTIVSLPLIDVPAFLPRSPFVCPIDNKNPNRFFPGDPGGTFTEVMNDALFRAVIEPSNALIDLHGGDLVEALVPFTVYSVSGNEEVNSASEAMARAMGLPYLVQNRPAPGGLGGMTIHAAAAAGIPAIIPEAGSCGLLTEPETQMLVDGIENVLRHLGVLEGPIKEMSAPTEVKEFSWLFAPTEGLWYPSVTVGDAVRTDQAIGIMTNMFGDAIAEVTAPHDGDVLFVTTSPAMREGGVLLAIGGL